MCSLRTNASRASGNVGNLLVDALPAPERDRLLDGAQHEVLPLRRVLFEPDQHLRKAYFPLGGVVSLVTPMLDGSAVEMATIGREGVVGVPALLEGGLPAGSRAVSQVQGEALSISAEAFRREVAAGGRLASLVYGFMQALFTLVGRNAACNRLHYMEQRCARWLLMTHDRVASDEFKLTQEFLAQMLGSRRASVTEAAAELQRSGAISYQRGTITVINREALEASACECYAVIRRVFDSLYPPD
jgi:CRP-like cAMP-binding protein